MDMPNMASAALGPCWHWTCSQHAPRRLLRCASLLEASWLIEVFNSGAETVLRDPEQHLTEAPALAVDALRAGPRVVFDLGLVSASQQSTQEPTRNC